MIKSWCVPFNLHVPFIAGSITTRYFFYNLKLFAILNIVHSGKNRISKHMPNGSLHHYLLVTLFTNQVTKYCPDTTSRSELVYTLLLNVPFD